MTLWVGQRVSWGKSGPDQRGLCLDAKLEQTEDRWAILLKVARDDGFIAYGVDADGCDRIPKEETSR